MNQLLLESSRKWIMKPKHLISVHSQEISSPSTNAKNNTDVNLMTSEIDHDEIGSQSDSDIEEENEVTKKSSKVSLNSFKKALSFLPIQLTLRAMFSTMNRKESTIHYIPSILALTWCQNLLSAVDHIINW
jgi:hypothetical protein